MSYPCMSEPENKNAGVAKGIYPIVKNMAVAFEFKLGERINEVDFARRLGASRTPLREGLNRLVAEGFLVMKQGRGFFCRDLKPREMSELYQFRALLEVAGVRLACEQTTEQEVADIAHFLHQTGPEDGGRRARN